MRLVRRLRIDLCRTLAALLVTTGLVAWLAPRSVAVEKAVETAHEKRTHPAGADVAVVERFQVRLKEYVVLHRKLEATLPKLTKEATPQQIDKNQRALCQLIRAARSGAKQGELFDHDMQKFVRKTLGRVFAGPDGKTLKSSIMDENPGIPNLAVNDRYPDDVPLSTMPPEVLSALPELEEDLEYRFVGESLVLYDTHAHTIIDLMDDVLPL